MGLILTGHGIGTSTHPNPPKRPRGPVSPCCHAPTRSRLGIGGGLLARLWNIRDWLARRASDCIGFHPHLEPPLFPPLAPRSVESLKPGNDEAQNLTQSQNVPGFKDASWFGGTRSDPIPGPPRIRVEQPAATDRVLGSPRGLRADRGEEPRRVVRCQTKAGHKKAQEAQEG